LSRVLTPPSTNIFLHASDSCGCETGSTNAHVLRASSGFARVAKHAV
jgi:hypothetical protein